MNKMLARLNVKCISKFHVVYLCFSLSKDRRFPAMGWVQVTTKICKDSLRLKLPSMPELNRGFLLHEASTNLYTWMERGTLRELKVSYTKKYNVVTPARTQTLTSRSGVQC